MKIKNLPLASLRVLLGSVFVVSGFQKLTSPYQNFAVVIEQFQILKGPAATILARTLPWAEFIAGVFFVTGFWEEIALAVLWAMNTVFIGVLIFTIKRKLAIDSCGCFGDAIKLSLPQILSLDLGFWVMFLFYFLKRRSVSPPGLDQLFAPRARR